MKPDTIRCDIFCRVIDNFGDAAVCWRLARQLALEHGWRVRLWIDQPEVLARLVPAGDNASVEVVPWRENTEDAAMIVIEAFACELPVAYIEAMARLEQTPVWINLEYLSAEDWVEGCHAMVSPHPRLALRKHFFFPGFTTKTGGLLREADYIARQSAFHASAFLAEFGLPPRLPGETVVSLFGYANPALPELLAAWAASPTPIRLLEPGGSVSAQHGNLSRHPLPFLPQRRYDELLWACDLNFVRGEDSFVRAQWAGKPFVWHIYPQSEEAHRAKLEAFLRRHPDHTLLAAFWLAWNGLGGSLDWPAFASHLGALQKGAEIWRAQLMEHRDLAENLVNFCRQRLK